mmetsp:Transcript_14352/g.25687  ORF Transcript_14352/g.25687 Transcript_14352/m.25687 type:complete len:451 (-) Transcript_14352:229-1581(-)
MPWLIKSTPEKEVPLSEHLFFVHVPRCGGTSLMQHFSVPQKVIDSRGPLGRLAMKYFFLRYKTLEKANFPIKTRENAFCTALLLIALASYSTNAIPYTLFGINVSVYVGGLSMFISFFTTIICTAPVIGRITPVHRWYLWFVHYPLFRLCEAIDWCTGTNKHGYIMHLTAPKLLGYGYVTPHQMDNMCSLAIVRNPYSRMVSIYGYNRFGKGETFKMFVRRWKKLMTPYLLRGEKEEWYTPCHLLPMFEFTHSNGKQLVQSVVKQEELKFLKTKEGGDKLRQEDSTVTNLPPLVRDALLGMPHTNRRATSKKWFDYYDQETMDLAYQMYHTDFQVFGYDAAIPQRPDLVPPTMDRRNIFGATKFHHFSRNSCMGPDNLRISNADLFRSVTKEERCKMILRSSTTALRSSIVTLDKAEILASVAGIRHISILKEDSTEMDASSARENKKDD